MEKKRLTGLPKWSLSCHVHGYGRGACGRMDISIQNLPSTILFCVTRFSVVVVVVVVVLFLDKKNKRAKMQVQNLPSTILFCVTRFSVVVVVVVVVVVLFP
jgi:ubiquitin C-terminal hydrolase